ncbi:hypothetical protein ACFZAM_10490 [Streptomyces sp. NPDC008079]|uniref:hypothetical protein n=1 Tax=Streptomyces sp. NPDC008079 TaxID=3364806 RepID=UPI0036EB73ED
MTDADATNIPTGDQPAHVPHIGPSFLERQRELQASLGYHGMALKDRIKRIGYVFQGNVTDYKALVASLQDPGVSLPIMDMRYPEAHDQLLSEAERLLHNVLTAMSTRVDQQRAFMRRYLAEDTVLTGEYRDRIGSSFSRDPGANFLKGLRNYIAHH